MALVSRGSICPPWKFLVMNSRFDRRSKLSGLLARRHLENAGTQAPARECGVLEALPPASFDPTKPPKAKPAIHSVPKKSLGTRLWGSARSVRSSPQLELFQAVVLMLGIFTAASAAETATENDWPMWRYDAGRSAASPNKVPDVLQLLWRRDYGQRQQAWDDPLNLDLMTYDRTFEPIVLDGRMFIGFNDRDKLLALDARNGNELWSYYAEGPVRLPPVGYKGRVYFCSDDGFLYCVDAKNGELVWKFSGAPNSQHVIGNRRVISAWPARGGPVIRDGKIYFAASIWPFMGTFIYALDAESGRIAWLNDSTGAQFIKQPHSAPSFAGVAPQGAMVATNKMLVVSGGRSVPAVLDRETGEQRYFEINAGGKGSGGSFVAANDNFFFVHTRDKGTRAFEMASGLKTAFMPNEPVLSGDILF